MNIRAIEDKKDKKNNELEKINYINLREPYECKVGDKFIITYNLDGTKEYYILAIVSSKKLGLININSGYRFTDSYRILIDATIHDKFNLADICCNNDPKELEIIIKNYTIRKI